MSVQLSAYRHAGDTQGVDVSFDAVVNRIRTGARGLDEKTKMCHVLAQTDKDAYRDYKAKELPAVTFAGRFPKNRRKANHLSVHSSLVVLDIDNLSENDIPLLLSELAQLQQVRLAFLSPSGVGIKVVVSVSQVPRDAAEHTSAWQACVDFFESLSEEYGFEIDGSGKDCSRLCFLSHDPQAIVHAESVPIGWDRDASLKEKAEREKRRVELEEKDWGDLEKDVSALDFIDADAYDLWTTVGMAIHEAGLPCEVWDQWSEKSAKYEAGACDQKWESFGNYTGVRATWGTVVFLAMENGYKPPQSTRRYTVDAEFQHEISDIDTERTANQNVLSQWLQETENQKGKHLLLLGGAAGTGKTTVAIMTSDNLLYISKTSEEADQVFQTLLDAGEDAIRHRPRLFNRDHPDWNTLPLGLTENDRPCIAPELCNLYAERGHATHDVCHRCPLLSECQETGYLSQDAKEQNAKKVVYAWDEAVACDIIHTERVKRICTKEDILIVDEVNPANLTQHRRVTRDMFYDLTERFKDGKTATEFETLKALLDLISTAEDETVFMEGLKAEIDAIADVEDFDAKLEKYPVGYVFTKASADKSYRFEATLHYRGKEVTVPVVSHETALDTPVFEIEADTPILPDKWHLSFLPVSVLLKVGLVAFSDPPRRFRRFLTDIKGFLDENRNLQTAPGTFDAKAQVFDFHLKPTLNHCRAVFNTASDPDNLITEAYRETEIQITRHSGKTPAWIRPLVFQLSTGNYLPRHSLLTEIAGETLQLKPRAQEMVDRFIVPSVAAGLKVLIVAPKAFANVRALDGLTACETVDLINHHHAEGRNDYQDHDIVFVFHYEPNHHAIVEIAKRLYRNVDRRLDWTREKRDITVNGVTFNKNAYIDERVQAVYHRECRERLMQSAMRLRPNIHAGKIVVFLTAEPVNIPVTPMPFSLVDGEGFDGDWQVFGEKLQADADATVQELVDAGVSPSKAYRDTEATRKQTKADRDVEIVHRYAAGQTQQRIADALEVGLATVNRVLKKQQF